MPYAATAVASLLASHLRRFSPPARMGVVQTALASGSHECAVQTVLASGSHGRSSTDGTRLRLAVFAWLNFPKKDLNFHAGALGAGCNPRALEKDLTASFYLDILTITVSLIYNTIPVGRNLQGIWLLLLAQICPSIQ